jgi:hypothetical protein
MDKNWWIVLYLWRVWVMRFQRIEQPLLDAVIPLLMNWPYSTLEQPQTDAEKYKIH